jgi:hypothetical protein
MSTLELDRPGTLLDREQETRQESLSWDAPTRALWLTERQAEVVLHLCATGSDCGSDAMEEIVFSKLGQLLRSFRSQMPGDLVGSS